MPFANLKVPADTLTPESKKKLIDAVTDAYADVYGERARATTLVLVDEVVEGGWGLGGNILTPEMLGRSCPEARACGEVPVHNHPSPRAGRPRREQLHD